MTLNILTYSNRANLEDDTKHPITLTQVALKYIKKKSSTEASVSREFEKTLDSVRSELRGYNVILKKRRFT